MHEAPHRLASRFAFGLRCGAETIERAPPSGRRGGSGARGREIRAARARAHAPPRGVTRRSPCAGAAARARAPAAPRCRPRRLRAPPLSSTRRSVGDSFSISSRESRARRATSHAGLEREHDRRRGGAAEVVRRDDALVRLERALARAVRVAPRGSSPSHVVAGGRTPSATPARRSRLRAPRRLALVPRANIRPAREERLERRGTADDEERSARLCHAVRAGPRLADGRCDGSRRSGRATSVRATCDGVSSRFAPSMRTPDRSTSARARARGAHGGRRRASSWRDGGGRCGSSVHGNQRNRRVSEAP